VQPTQAADPSYGYYDPQQTYYGWGDAYGNYSGAQTQRSSYYPGQQYGAQQQAAQQYTWGGQPGGYASTQAVALPTQQAPVRGSSSSPIQAIYTLHSCPHCMELEGLLQQKGVQLSTTETNQRYYGAYPTVVYSDGSTDHGDRIYGNSVQLPSSIKIIQTY
jgi:hypothetical protein